MDNKPKQKPKDSSWKDENERKNTPYRRPDEEQIHDFDTPSRSGQKASKRDVGSEPRESDKLDGSQLDRRQKDMSRNQSSEE